MKSCRREIFRFLSPANTPSQPPPSHGEELKAKPEDGLIGSLRCEGSWDINGNSVFATFARNTHPAHVFC